MKKSHRLAGIAFAAFTAIACYGAPTHACGGYGDTLPIAAARAADADPAVSDAAIARLRAAGPDGLKALMAAHADAIARHAENPTAKDPAWCNVATSIDRVAAQRDAWASGLYWYTDLEQAKAAAKAQNKPILTLRLLGTLDSDLSCANSRFFRTALYANKELSAYLRENFVLHWKSVRPVPKVTIDFGDGRVVERTITGNSIHYVLDADGLPVDGIPGLYGPAAFRARLESAATVSSRFGNLDPERRWRKYAAWHAEQDAAALRQWDEDLKALGVPVAGRTLPADGTAVVVEAPAAPQPPKDQPPKALPAARLAVGKARAEVNLVRALTPSAEVLTAATDDAVWQRIAQRHAEESRLDAGSRTVVAAKQPAPRGRVAAAPNAAAAGPRAAAKWEQEDPMFRVLELVGNFERSMAMDTVKNEYTFHRSIHQWLASAKAPPALEPFNDRVYAELFLTPSTDPWLGLAPADAYSAIDGEGLRTAGK
ncbi:MAG TPA: hypothetical protein VF796_18270 [Humisphaera sp.]